jgi:hypothetical protein
MATYNLYHLRAGQLAGSEVIEAEDDREAARIAEARGWGDLVEIWNGAERVRIVRPGGALLSGQGPDSIGQELPAG